MCLPLPSGGHATRLGACRDRIDPCRGPRADRIWSHSLITLSRVGPSVASTSAMGLHEDCPSTVPFGAPTEGKPVPMERQLCRVQIRIEWVRVARRRGLFLGSNPT